jgi:hypothetical protein
MTVSTVPVSAGTHVASCAATAAVVVAAARASAPGRSGGLLGRMLPFALAEAELADARAPRGHRSAVHALEHARLLELVEIAAHGLGGDVEPGGEVGDRDAAHGAQVVGDRLVAFRRVHPGDLFVV